MRIYKKINSSKALAALITTLAGIILLLCVTMKNTISADAEEAYRFLNNSLVFFSPDRTAFTIGYGDKSAQCYDYGRQGTIVNVQGVKEQKPSGEGEHYYRGIVVGDVPVGYWKLGLAKGKCIHSNPAMQFDISALNRMGCCNYNCNRYYNAGWYPYCADCGEMIVPLFFYITEQMAVRTTFLPSGTPYSNYFYLCPYDNSLENYKSIEHTCSIISANRYKLVYNAGNVYATGKMQAEWFCYDNAEEYEGVAVEAKSTLTLCAYSVKNREFIGWSDRPDGEVLFVDGAEWTTVQNTLGVGKMQDESSVILYAVWSKDEEEQNGPDIDDYDDDRKQEVDDLKLTARITRSLNNIDGIDKFRYGESGVLSIRTEGQADYVQVEFPKVMAGYNTFFDYSKNKSDVKEEEMDFTIPLTGIQKDTEKLIVRVTAYKNEKIISSYPVICLLPGESILDELRTSLR